MLDFKSMAIYMIKHPLYYKDDLIAELQELANDCIGVWHVSSRITGVKLDTFLGLTPGEYFEYALNSKRFFENLVKEQSVGSG